MGLREHITVWLSFSKKERYGIYLILFVYALIWVIPFTFTTEKVPEDMLQFLPLDSMAYGGLVFGDSLRKGKVNRPLPNRQWHQPDKDHYTSIRSSPSPSFTSPQLSQRTAKLLDLNLADSAALERLPGIGKKLSSRIVRYRERLGGFVRIQQLEEVYGLHDSTLALILPYLRIEPDFVPQKLYINRVDLDALGRHPYTGYVLGKMLLAYRKQHGKFESGEMLLQAAMGETDRIAKMIPYCSFED